MFFNSSIKHVVFLLLLIVVFYVLIILLNHFPDHFDKTIITPKNTTAYVINLDKNPDRLEEFTKTYNQSDIHEIQLTRFPAIWGKNVNTEEWLSPEAIEELNQVERKGYRTYHYQLTRGAIGCFLSHYTLAKKLLEDKRNDYYIIMEDDIAINPKGFKEIQETLLNVPEDWDIILFGFLRIIHPEYVGNFIKPNGFWGTHGYLINKKGAKKFVDETNLNKIDGQVDAYFSRMIQQQKINIYAHKKHIFFPIGRTSNIQTGLRIREGIDPFNYKGYIV
jgi:GR25 family glycosyltransferase involved in LPS biosynthesis